MSKFPLYTVDYISNAMSLRKPQKESLVRLDTILKNIHLQKDMDLDFALGAVHHKYETCSSFEHPFMSLAFSLATGVGKTRLMGAFITYLYTQHDYKNFFIVAPNTTIYEKLRQDLGVPGSSKYVFNGLGCYNNPPMLITEEDYRSKQLFSSGINLFVYNIDKFNKDSSKMNQLNEHLGESFTQKLSKLDDLVLIMDESHHYRADRGLAALNDLHPLLGLELTATPKYNNGSKQVVFKNVVYEYPLSKAIADGYTRTPYALTRADMPKDAFGDEELDRLMISDGIKNHERVKKILKDYSDTNNKRLVKPFMLIVCKDTEHANSVFKYVTSQDFHKSYYSDKTIVVHSKMSGAESDENTQKLLAVESSEEHTEIVIHVNKLKEGWDVNNLYTIVPLRAAASDILKEQMVGRGLRLPYGMRTGIKEIDAVTLTAHDKFNEILAAAQKGDSIFKAGNIIKVEELENEKTVTPSYTLDLFSDEDKEDDYTTTGLEKSAENDSFLEKTKNVIESIVSGEMIKDDAFSYNDSNKAQIKAKIEKEINKNQDLAKMFEEHRDPLVSWLDKKTEKVYKTIKDRHIPIPKIRITDEGTEVFHFVDFDLDFSELHYSVVDDKVIIQNMIDQSEQEILDAEKIDLNINPKKTILELMLKKPEIDYDSCGELLRKLITQFCNYYEEKEGANGMRNIVLMNKYDICSKIYAQLLRDDHFYCENTFFKEEVSSINSCNIKPQYDKVNVICSIYDDYKESTEGSIKSVLFNGLKKSVFDSVKFDSTQELYLARILERDGEVIHWLRPAPNEFNIKYNRGKNYQPDFVIETKDVIYLTEVKDAGKVYDTDVIAKKKRGIHYCAVASVFGKANGYKEWRYLFIPHDQIKPNGSTFNNLMSRFTEENIYESKVLYQNVADQKTPYGD
ncbi:MAG: DEAD/DEAH box helicase family protein [Spirochaetaceae bacterium]|nr:DEAD/DEAH box helicase family protein [Spirochaetaceae bacterium]